MILLKKISNRFIKVIYQYTASLANDVSSISNVFEFKTIEAKDIDILYAKYPREIKPRKKHILKSRIDDENINSFFAINNNNITGYYHVSKKILFDSLIDYEETLPDKTVYFFDDYTFLDFRGMGSHAFSIQKRKEICGQANFKTAITHIMKGNTFSERAYTKFGFKKTKRILWINLLFKKIIILKDV